MSDHPRPSRRAWVIGAVAAVLAFTSIVVVALLLMGEDDDEPKADGPTTSEPDRSAGTTSTTAAPDTGASGELEREVAELSRFVEEARGGTFERPVDVELLGPAAFEARLLEDFGEDVEELDKTERLLRALRLLDDDADLVEGLRGLLGGGAVGLYDPETGELVVRGGAITPYVRSTIVHELVHAYDDQQFELHRPELDDADDESSLAFSALVEGNAVRVEEAWLAGLSDDERMQAEAEEAEVGASVDMGSIPEVVINLVGFPYLVGAPFVEALVDDGGEEAVDRALADPPTTSEQIIQPDTYLDGQDIVRVEKPRPDAALVDEGVLGHWGLVLMLSEELPPQRVGPAAAGWGGDWYVAWQRGAQTCVRTSVASDSADDLDQLTSALEQWADAVGGAEVQRQGETVTFTVCG